MTGVTSRVAPTGSRSASSKRYEGVKPHQALDGKRRAKEAPCSGYSAFPAVRDKPLIAPLEVDPAVVGAQDLDGSPIEARLASQEASDCKVAIVSNEQRTRDSSTRGIRRSSYSYRHSSRGQVQSYSRRSPSRTRWSSRAEDLSSSCRSLDLYCCRALSRRRWSSRLHSALITKLNERCCARTSAWPCWPSTSTHHW